MKKALCSLDLVGGHENCFFGAAEGRGVKQSIHDVFGRVYFYQLVYIGSRLKCSGKSSTGLGLLARIS